MAKIWLEHYDGRYSIRLLSDEEASKLEAQGFFDVAHLEDSVYDAYKRHCEQDGIWQALWRSIANEQFTRRRERILMPLEDAQREIDRLKEELARAERLREHFEENWKGAVRAVRGCHRSPPDKYTCVYPQPGCDVEILPPAWRERAKEILAKYRTDLADEGMRVQGCCCGNDHQQLHGATLAQLHHAGFIVEHCLDLYEEEGAP